MEKLTSGGEMSFDDVKKLFDRYEELDELFGECCSIFLELTSENRDKYEEEAKVFVNAERLKDSIRQDAGAVMFSIAGQLENYKRAYPDAFKKRK